MSEDEACQGCLGRQKAVATLASLHKLAKREGAYVDDPELEAEVVRALSPAAVPVPAAWLKPGAVIPVTPETVAKLISALKVSVHDPIPR